MTTSMQYTFGIHAVLSMLENNPDAISIIYVQKDRRDKKILALLKIAQTNPAIEIRDEKRSVLDTLVGGENHQGIVAVRQSIRIYGENDIADLLNAIAVGPPLLLVLDGVQDPHNLGACFRSAEAAGVHAIIVPKDKSVGMTATVIKVASGAVETIPFIQVTNLARAIERLKTAGIWIYGADSLAESTIYDHDFAGPIALVLGAEGTGLRRLTKEMCDHLMKIPMQGRVGSLNVSVAAGICLFETVRQRKFGYTDKK